MECKPEVELDHSSSMEVASRTGNVFPLVKAVLIFLFPFGKKRVLLSRVTSSADVDREWALLQGNGTFGATASMADVFRKYHMYFKVTTDSHSGSLHLELTDRALSFRAGTCPAEATSAEAQEPARPGKRKWDVTDTGQIAGNGCDTAKPAFVIRDGVVCSRTSPRLFSVTTRPPGQPDPSPVSLAWALIDPTFQTSVEVEVPRRYVPQLTHKTAKWSGTKCEATDKVSDPAKILIRGHATKVEEARSMILDTLEQLLAQTGVFNVEVTRAKLDCVRRAGRALSEDLRNRLGVQMRVWDGPCKLNFTGVNEQIDAAVQIVNNVLMEAGLEELSRPPTSETSETQGAVVAGNAREGGRASYHRCAAGRGFFNVDFPDSAQTMGRSAHANPRPMGNPYVNPYAGYHLAEGGEQLN